MDENGAKAPSVGELHNPAAEAAGNR